MTQSGRSSDLCGKHLHDRIIALRGKIWTDETSLTPPFIIEVPVPSQESQRSCCICVLRVSSFVVLSTIFRSDYGTVPTVSCLLFHFNKALQ
jgi:hypothetical protein